MRLLCLLPYRGQYQHQALGYAPGDLIDGEPAFLDWLRRDAPSCFTVQLPEPEPRAVEAPPHDRLLEAAPNRAPAGRRGRR